MEEWKPIPGTDDHYEVSTLGRVRLVVRHRQHAPKILAIRTTKLGYKRVSMRSVSGKQIAPFVHRLVLSAFVRARHDGEEVNHKNGIKGDNRVENLEWVTRSENQQHAIRLGRTLVGTRKQNSKLDYAKVQEAKEMRRAGVSTLKIARHFGISEPAMWAAINGVTWKNNPAFGSATGAAISAVGLAPVARVVRPPKVRGPLGFFISATDAAGVLDRYPTRGVQS